eukprot:349447-Pyramimonas_sp.AAC.1
MSVTTAPNAIGFVGLCEPCVEQTKTRPLPPRYMLIPRIRLGCRRGIRAYDWVAPEVYAHPSHTIGLPP